jgi:hypothetical protein
MQIKEDKMGKVCSTHGIAKKCISNFGRKSYTEETTGIPKENIRIGIRGIEWEVGDWMHLA